MNNTQSMQGVFQEIADWKTDAKLENSMRYFYESAEAERLVSGRRAFVIGRKGTGKTAIAHHIASKSAHHTFSQKLSLKNFPWNILYDLKDRSFRAPNEYITIWKYIIYTYILHLMMENNNIDSGLSAQLRTIFHKDAATALAKTIKQWTAANFNISILEKLTLGISGTSIDKKTI